MLRIPTEFHCLQIEECPSFGFRLAFSASSSAFKIYLSSSLDLARGETVQAQREGPERWSKNRYNSATTDQIDPFSSRVIGYHPEKSTGIALSLSAAQPPFANVLISCLLNLKTS